MIDSASGRMVLKSFNTTWLFPLILWGMGFPLLGVTWLLRRLLPRTHT